MFDSLKQLNSSVDSKSQEYIKSINKAVLILFEDNTLTCITPLTLKKGISNKLASYDSLIG